MKLIKAYNQYLLKILPILNYSFFKNELSITISFKKIIPIFFFLKIIQIPNLKFYQIFVLLIILIKKNVLKLFIIY
jgi:hypothetical protein